MNNAGVGIPARGNRKSLLGPYAPPSLPPRPTWEVIHAGGGPGQGGPELGVLCGSPPGGSLRPRPGVGFPSGLGEG